MIITHLAAGYYHFTYLAIAFLLRLDWWLLHRWWFLAAGMTYDLIKYGMWPQIRRLLWQRKLMKSAW